MGERAVIPERIRWAAELLSLKPSDTVLEVGCGAGLLVSLLCPDLTSGYVVALDRSPAMVRLAEARNHSFISDGKAQILNAALATAALGEARFTKAIAVNVNVFWQRPHTELAVLRRTLMSAGLLHLVYEPPSPEKTLPIAEQARKQLESGGFTVIRTQVRQLGRASGVALTAVPSGADKLDHNLVDIV